MLTDKRKLVEKFVQIKTMDELKEAINKKWDIYLQDGEDFEDDGIMWDTPQKKDIFISEVDTYSGANVLCVKNESSYSYVDKNGLFRRRQGHEHLTMVLIKTLSLGPLISKIKEGYLVAGNVFTEQEILKALKIDI